VVYVTAWPGATNGTVTCTVPPGATDLPMALVCTDYGKLPPASMIRKLASQLQDPPLVNSQVLFAVEPGSIWYPSETVMSRTLPNNRQGVCCGWLAEDESWGGGW